MKTLLLIDGHAMIHRAFHALPITLSTTFGEPTGAVYGFFLMLQKVIGDFKPTHIAIAFDTPKPTFRKKLYKAYQAKRPPMDNDLKTQIPIIKDLLDKGGIKRFERPGFEADDVIGTLTEQNKKKFDRILILTGDRDLLQLTDTNVFLIAPKRGVTHFDLFTPQEVKKKYGSEPIHLPDYKALAGDSSDNYNTARGIGPKTARSILAVYQTIEELFAHIDELENERWKSILKEFKEKIVLFKKIATILRDIDVHTKESELIFTHFDENMKPVLSHLELFSLIKKLYNVDPQEKMKKKSVEKGKEPEQIDLF